MNLYTLGVKHTVVVDDFIPLQQVEQEDGSFQYQTIFSHVGEDQSMWGVILEKAFAKFHGNYEHLTAGDPRAAARSLNGSPSRQLVHASSAVDDFFLWEWLSMSDAEDEMMFLLTPGSSDAMVNTCGLT